MAHILKQITEAIVLHKVRNGVVGIDVTAVTGSTDDYHSTTIIVTDAVARALAGGLVEIAGASVDLIPQPVAS